MKRMLLAVALLALLAGAGCTRNLNSCNSCGPVGGRMGGGGCPTCQTGNCRGGDCMACRSGRCLTANGVPSGRPAHVGHVSHGEELGPAGPPSPTFAYPYYTTRGPRDFLLDNPPSIGR